MNVVDSSGWIEYFADGPNADFFAGAIEATSKLVVPTLSLFEVFRKVLRDIGETEALRAVATMQKGEVVELDAALALDAAALSVREHLPMADSIILGTARRFGATLWTQDSDFEGIEGVRFISRGADRR